MVNFRIIYMGCPIYLSLQNCNIIHLFFITELSKINIYFLKSQLIVKSKLDNDYIYTFKFLDFTSIHTYIHIKQKEITQV